MPVNSSHVDRGLNIELQLSFIPDAGLLDPLTTNNSPQNNSASFSSDPLPSPPNTRPYLRSLSFSTGQIDYRENEILNVSGEASDPDGFADLAGIDFKIRLQNGSYIDIADATSFKNQDNAPVYGHSFLQSDTLQFKRRDLFDRGDHLRQ